MHRRQILSALGVCVCVIVSSAALGTVAYVVPAGQAGNQAFGGALGMDFDTNHAIVVTRLGAFDDGSNGLNLDITGKLWERTTQTELASLSFTTGNPGVLEGGSRFKGLAAPIILPTGFQGTIAAGGYGAGEQNGNSGGAIPPNGTFNWSTDSGGGLISFVGGGRFANPFVATNFPNQADGGPANRYAAGTFDFAPANIAYEVPAGAVGNQGFGGSLGMDFDVNEDIRITQLGVFDSGQDGLANAITAHIYDRTNTASPLATLVFGPGADGVLIGGSRFKDLASPLYLPAGFQGTIVAEGYSAAEPNGNQGSVNLNTTTFDGFGMLSFVGGGRFGTAGSFPGTGDGGPADRYLAGTFRFTTPPLVPEPVTPLLLLLGGVGLVARRNHRRLAA